MTLKRSRSSRTTAIESASPGWARASEWAIRSVSSSRFGSPVVGSYRAPRWATSTRRALSIAIEASWANRLSASISRSPNGRSGRRTRGRSRRRPGRRSSGARRRRRRAARRDEPELAPRTHRSHRPRRAGPSGRPRRDPLADRDALPDVPSKSADAVAHDEFLDVGFGDVDVAVRRPEQRARAGQDRDEQHGRVALVEQGQGRLIERAQVRVVGDGSDRRPWPRAWRGTSPGRRSRRARPSPVRPRGSTRRRC